MRADNRQPDGKSWYRITNQSDGPAQVYLYDVIGLFGVSAKDFLADLAAIDGPVDVHINSDGGDCFEAFAIYGALLARPGVTTIVDSVAASAASVIAMAGEQRLMARTSQMMIHDAWAGIDGNAADLEHMMGRLNVMSGQVAGIYADTAGGTPEHWRGLMQAETWFTPEQALAAGLITGIVAGSRVPVPAGAGAAAAAQQGGILAAAHVPWDPDGDGDDDSTPEGDTDHSHWAADGTQKKSVPGKPMPGQPPAEDPTPNNAAPAAAPASQAAAVTPSGRTVMGNNDGTLTIEGRRSRIAEIEGRCREVMASYPASVFPADVQTEWDRLVIESREHRQALEAVDQRNADVAQMYAGSPGSHDAPLDDAGRPQGSGQRRPAGAPAFHPSRDIYDLVGIQQQARNHEELPGLYRDNALRAIEQHRFPGTNRETAQENVARLLDSVSDDHRGEVARRILATGSPAYTRVFGRALQAGNPGALGGQDAQILALGESPDTAGGYAVPFQLDPTLVLTTSGGVSPLRDISRVERIVGKEYDLVTTGKVIVQRVTEGTPAVDGSPTLGQPTVRANRVQGFIPFSVELEGDWTALQGEMMKLLADAKFMEEADSDGATTGFFLGTGVSPQAGGIITTMPGVAGGSGGSSVRTTTALAFALADIFKVKNALGNRYRARAQWVANSAIYDLCRQFGTSIANIWAESLQAGVPSKLIGYPVNEGTAMSSATGTTLSPILIYGAFDNYLIVDRVGMNLELVPTLTRQATAGAGVGMPVGQRGYYCWWRNNAVIVNANAFRVLQP